MKVSLQSLQHTLKNRHIQMIALGGAIGTGFFLASASAISMTGPSIIATYILGGVIIYGIMRALGEMTVDNPNPGAFMEYARIHMGETAGFIVGWNTWLLFTVVCMLEVCAAGVLLDHWIHIPYWITSVILLSILGSVNLIGVKYFGETEFWFAGIKIAVIIFMIVAGTYLLSTHHAIQDIAKQNIHNYSSMSGFFTHGSNGFLLSLAMVILSFGGSEFVSIAAGEAENPKKSIPKAINNVVLRIILFYVCTITLIVLMYPSNQIDAHTNPFTDVFSKLGFSKSADIINLVAITATLSSLNSCLYVASRFLFSMAHNNMAPKKFTTLNKSVVPGVAVLFTIGIAYIVVLANYIFPAQVMGYLFSIVSIGFIINWYIILLSHIAFRRKHKNEVIEYKMPFYPWVNIIIMLILLVVMMAMTTAPDMAISVYIAPFWIVFLIICHKLFVKPTKANS